jgi:hypothetical protein
MKPVDQTRFDGPGGGNCLGACLASILEVPLESVDRDALYKPGLWQAALIALLQEYGYQPFWYSPGGELFPQIYPPGYHIACSATHATVALDGYVVHDPHPKRKGLKEITEWILLLPLKSRVEAQHSRSLEIVHACTETQLFAMGISKEPPPSLDEYTLEDLIDAQRAIREENARRTDGGVTVVSDDRGIAALYVATHFDAEPADACEPIAVVGNRAVVVVDVNTLTQETR